MEKPYKHLNVLVMPTDACNLNCVYCFHSAYHERVGRMSTEVLYKMTAIILNDYDNVSFIWHGGEPLLMGIDFYQKALDKQAEYKGKKIKNSIQSNLTMMDDKFAKFLAKNHIGIGSSFDGVCNEALRGNTQAVEGGRRILKQVGKRCGFIMVVSQKNISTLIDSYELFKGKKINFTINLYIPIKSRINDNLVLKTSDAIKYISEFYDYWINDKDCNINIHYFERILEYIVWGNKTLCKYTSCLGKWIGIRYDGSIVPCNRYFPDEYGYGNVMELERISDAFESEGFKRLLRSAIARREKCKGCEIYPFCEGGCNNVAYNERGIENNGGQSCIILRNIYKYICDDIKFRGTDIPNPIARELITIAPKKGRSHCDIHTDTNRSDCNEKG